MVVSETMGRGIGLVATDPRIRITRPVRVTPPQRFPFHSGIQRRERLRSGPGVARGIRHVDATGVLDPVQQAGRAGRKRSVLVDRPDRCHDLPVTRARRAAIARPPTDSRARATPVGHLAAQRGRADARNRPEIRYHRLRFRAGVYDRNCRAAVVRVVDRVTDGHVGDDTEGAGERTVGGNHVDELAGSAGGSDIERGIGDVQRVAHRQRVAHGRLRVVNLDRKRPARGNGHIARTERTDRGARRQRAAVRDRHDADRTRAAQRAGIDGRRTGKGIHPVQRQRPVAGLYQSQTAAGNRAADGQRRR